MMQGGSAGGEGDNSVANAGLGPVRRRQYAPNVKHGPIARGIIARAPVNGQDALDYSVRIKPTARVRVGVDYDDRSFVVLRFHEMGEFRDTLNYEIFHGYSLDWWKLDQEQRNALMRWGLADLRGRIR